MSPRDSVSKLLVEQKTWSLTHNLPSRAVVGRRLLLLLVARRPRWRAKLASAAVAAPAVALAAAAAGLAARAPAAHACKARSLRGWRPLLCRRSALGANFLRAHALLKCNIHLPYGSRATTIHFIGSKRATLQRIAKWSGESVWRKRTTLQDKARDAPSCAMGHVAHRAIAGGILLQDVTERMSAAPSGTPSTWENQARRARCVCSDRGGPGKHANDIAEET